MRTVAAFLLCAWATGCLAAVPDIQPDSFRILSEVDGLSEGVVGPVVQDKAGFIWFGTWDGLDRYDGYSFRVFRPTPGDTQSISDYVNFALHIDRDGNLWSGTKNGMDRYDPVHESFTRFLAREKIPLHVYAIADAEPGALWLTSTEGLIHLDTTTSVTRTTISSVFDNDSRLLRDRSGTVWLASHLGLATIDATGMRLVPFPDPRLGHAVVTSMYETSAGVMWFGTAAGGLYSLSRDRKRLQEHPIAMGMAKSRITSIVERADGALWIGTFNKDLLIYDPSDGQWAQVSIQANAHDNLPRSAINDVYIDHDNRLWVTRGGPGVAVLNPRIADFHPIGTSQSGTAALKNLEAHAVLMDADHHLWVGTALGLDVFSSDLRQVKYYGSDDRDAHGLRGQDISSLLQDRHKHIWVGIYEGGLCEYRPESDDFKCYTPNSSHSLRAHVGINTMAEGADGFLWLGVQHTGLFRFDTKTGEFRSFPVNTNKAGTTLAEIDQIVASPDGSVWVGTWGAGLYRLDTKTGYFTQISAAETSRPRLTSNNITTLLFASETRLWIGTADGLDLLDTRAGEVRNWTVTDGLPDNFVQNMAQDGSGKLWVGTNFGLAQLDPAQGIVDRFQSEDGLPTDEFNETTATRSDDGTIYMGTLNGIVSFKGEAVHRAHATLRVTLTDLLRYGKRVDIKPDVHDGLLTQSIVETRSLVLPYTRPQITLGFSALHAPNPAHQRFAYRFRGFDDRWINMEPGRHSVDYYPQTAGHFVFEVRAVADNGRPIGDSTSLDITVLPAPWLSPMAYTLYAVAALAAVLALLWQLWRRISLERHKHELMRLTESRLQLALRAGRAAAWTADLEGAAIHAPELMAQLGYHDIEGPVMYQAFLQLVHVDDRLTSFGRVFEEALASTGQVDIEFRVRRREGGYIRLQMCGQVVSHGAAGRPLTAAGTFREVDFG